MALFFLTSCSNGDKTAGPSLNADDRWDWMAAEREKPLPVITPDDDNGKSRPPPPSIAGLLENDIDKLRARLEKADEEYDGIAASLDADFSKKPATKKETDRQTLWRTMQLHLSRLINLQKNIAIATKKLESTSGVTDKIMLDHSRSLITVMTKRIEYTRQYLDNFNPGK